MTNVLEVRDLHAYYRTSRGLVEAVAGVDLTVRAGRVIGVVGESGCGKSTLAAAITGVHARRTGSVLFNGRELRPLGHRSRSPEERRLQMIFQNPHTTFNPRRRIGRQLQDAVRFAGEADGHARIRELLDMVGLAEDARERYPHEFSGGQLQRLAIARALAARPSLIVADEPIAALDASAQVQIAELLADLVRQQNASVLFISHDLSVVKQITDSVAVMYLGRIVETGPTETVWRSHAHPYTRALIAAIPHTDGEQRLPAELAGEVPNPARPPSGCRFHPRCAYAMSQCRTTAPAVYATGTDQTAECWLHESGELVVSKRPTAVGDP